MQGTVPGKFQGGRVACKICKITLQLWSLEHNHPPSPKRKFSAHLHKPLGGAATSVASHNTWNLAPLQDIPKTPPRPPYNLLAPFGLGFPWAMPQPGCRGSTILGTIVVGLFPRLWEMRLACLSPVVCPNPVLTHHAELPRQGLLQSETLKTSAA